MQNNGFCVGKWRKSDAPALRLLLADSGRTAFATPRRKADRSQRLTSIFEPAPTLRFPVILAGKS
jgi:hypothetical protein